MNLFVGNLNPETTASGLRPLFSEFGEVVSAKVIMDNATGMSRGFGFVEMADKGQAIDAIDNLDSTFFQGNIISVKEAKQNSSSGGGNARPGNSNRSFRPRMPRQDNYNRDNRDSYNRDNRESRDNYNRDRYNSL